MSDSYHFLSTSNVDSIHNENELQENQQEQEQQLLDSTYNDNYDFELFESILIISSINKKIAFSYYNINSTKIELSHEMYEFDDLIVTRNVLAKFQPNNIIISSQCPQKIFSFLKKLSMNSSEDMVILMNHNNNDDNCDNGSNENVFIDNNDNNNDISITMQNTSSIDNQVVDNHDNENEDDTDENVYLGDLTLNLLSNQFKLYVISSKLFNYERCKSHILSFDFKPITHISDKTSRYIYLTSYIDFSEINTIRAFGVLLSLIEKKLTPVSTMNNINEFSYFYLDYFLSIDRTTYEAIDIFKNEWHPSLSKKGLTKKEGFSLYGVFNSCASTIGSKYLRQMFLQPITDIDALEQRLDFVEFFHDSDNQEFKASIRDLLKNVKHLSPLINRIGSSNCRLNDFNIIKQNLISIISIRNCINNRLLNRGKKFKFCEKLSDQLILTLDEIIDHIDKIIDFGKSNDECGKISIKSGIDEELDRKKFYFNNLPTILRNAIDDEKLINELIQNYNINITVLYVPQLGFLLKLSLIDAQRIHDIDKYGLRLLFCAESSAYYKNVSTDHYDSLFGDIHGEISDLINKNLIKLKEFIIERIDSILMANTYCAFIDAIIAISQAAIDLNLSRPKLTCEGVIKIEEGRHPLYELITRSFEANDYCCNDGSNKIMVIFGQNGCGKTVYLKQICLTIFLAHIGSFVPAKLAVIQIIDRIFTRISTSESITTQLSAFKIDLNQMINGIKYARRRSLFIVDCFGKGTLPVDGISLLKSFIDYYSNPNSDVQLPYLIISTHYNRLLSMINPLKITIAYFNNEPRDYKLKLHSRQQPYSNNPDSDIIKQTTTSASDEIVNLMKKVYNEEHRKVMVDKLKKHFHSYLRLADMILDESYSLDSINTYINETILQPNQIN